MAVYFVLLVELITVKAGAVFDAVACFWHRFLLQDYLTHLALREEMMPSLKQLDILRPADSYGRHPHI